MKVYLIENSSGSYDDYYSYIKTGYFDKNKAQEYVDSYNKSLDAKRLQSEECYSCISGKFDYLSKVIRNCKLCARKSNIKDVEKIDGGLYFECDKSEDSYYMCDEHYAVIKEIEIVE